MTTAILPEHLDHFLQSCLLFALYSHDRSSVGSDPTVCLRQRAYLVTSQPAWLQSSVTELVKANSISLLLRLQPRLEPLRLDRKTSATFQVSIFRPSEAARNKHKTDPALLQSKRRAARLIHGSHASSYLLDLHKAAYIGLALEQTHSPVPIKGNKPYHTPSLSTPALQTLTETSPRPLAAMPSPTTPTAQSTSHLISARAARDANFRDVLAMVMEGRAPKDYVEGFWAEVENMRLDEAERQVAALAQRNEMLRRQEEARRRMRLSGARVYGSLGEWFEDYKEGRTTAVELGLGVEGTAEEGSGDGDTEEEGEDGDIGVEGYDYETNYRQGSIAREAGAVRDDGAAVGLTRSLRPRNAPLEAGPSGSDGDDEHQDTRSDDSLRNGEKLQDSSEDEEARDGEGDTTMLDDGPDAMPVVRKLCYGRRFM